MAERPVDELFLENTKLNPTLARAFGERILEFSTAPDAVREAARPAVAYPGHEQVALPGGFPLHGPPLWSVLRRRRTRRAFGTAPLSKELVARLLWHAAGETGQRPVDDADGPAHPLRAAPSAGGLHAVEVYVVALRVDGLAPGAYHYAAPAHALERLPLAAAEAPRVLDHLLLMPGMERAPLALVLAGAPERLRAKYGERGLRFLLLDAGHLAQNLLLAAEGLGLAAVTLGGFHDDALDAFLGLPERRMVSLYPVLVGTREGGEPCPKPSAGDRA